MSISRLESTSDGPETVASLIEWRGEIALSSPPLPLTPIIGRTEEVSVVSDLLRQRTIRLVTLIGPGGIGKTRLALQVSADMQGQFRDGIAFVGLAPVRDHALVLEAIADATGVRGPASRTLETALRDRQLLLILDNFEHLLDTAPDISSLLAQCPHLTILATSRAPLRLSGEHVFPVPPFSVPSLQNLPAFDELSVSSPVALFVSRARAADPGFVLDESNVAAVAEICARLDGVPLAIELAAARSRLLAPSALLARMSQSLDVIGEGSRDSPDRQRTMQAAIAWSLDLLTPAARDLLYQLALFVGGFDLAAAEAVAGRERGEMIAAIETLLDHGMLRRHDDSAGEPRFRVPETIREFGLSSPATGDEATMQRRFAAWALALAEDAERGYATPAGDQWIARVESEEDNVRAALTWFASSGDEESLLRLAGALRWYWQMMGRLVEGQRWLIRARHASPEVDSLVRATALVGASTLTAVCGDPQTSDELAEEGVALFLANDNRHGAAQATHMRSLAATYAGNLEDAVTYAHDALQVFESFDDPFWTAWTANRLGIAAADFGDLERAEASYGSALAGLRRLQQPSGQAMVLANLALLLNERGERARAVALFRESISRARERHISYFMLVDTLLGLVDSVAEQLDPVQAARILGVVDRERTVSGFAHGHQTRDVYRRAVTRAQQALSETAFEEAWTEGHGMSLAEAMAIAMTETESFLTPADSLPEDFAITAPQLFAPSQQPLSKREIEVLRLLVSGQTDRQIADTLFISPATARTHVSHILHKLDVSSRTAAVAYAFQYGLV